MTIDLLCLGNLTIDDVVLPDGTTKMACFGGDTIYAALGASFWSDKIRFVAPVGTDFPREHISRLHDAGWDIQGLVERSIQSIRSWVVYEHDGRRTWILRSDPDNFLELSPTFLDIPESYLDTKASLILAMDLAAQEELVRHLRALGIAIALDPQEDYISGNQERILSMLKEVDIFLPSEKEVFRILGHTDYKQAALQFAECGCKVVVIKLGEKGALIFDRAAQEYWQIPAYPTKAVDPTGAGDTFAGGFMAMYMKSGDLLRSGLAGSVSASFAVEDFGLSHLLEVDQNEAAERLIDLTQSFNHQNSVF